MAFDLEAIRERVASLSPHAARALAFRLVTHTVAAFVGQLPSHEEYTQQLAIIAVLVGRYAKALHAPEIEELHAEADALHCRLFVGARSRCSIWPFAERIPADLAQAIRRATSPQLGHYLDRTGGTVIDPLALLIYDLQNLSCVYRYPWEPCEAAIVEALEEQEAT